MQYNEIKNIKFGILSSEEIQTNAVCTITSTNVSGPNTIYDERMGVIENNKTCPSCGFTNKLCPGHYGCIKLPCLVYHPMYYKYVTMFLNMFCSSCSRLVISSSHFIVDKIGHSIECVNEYVQSVGTCYHCNSQRVQYGFNSNDIVYYKIGQNKEKVDITIDQCMSIFFSIIDEDIKLLGINPSMMHPKNIVLEYIPVIPTRSRPYIILDGNICDDDLSIVYQTIVKICDKFTPDNLSHLIFHITTLMNNSEGKSKHNHGSRPIKGIKERISGKDGIIRNNMSGKRVNQSARTVIGPDPTLKTDEVAIPEKIASKLTVMEYVTDFNINAIQNIVNSHKANFVIRNSSKINLSYASFTQETDLKHGDVIVRNGRQVFENYKDGDMIHRDGQTLEFVQQKQRVFNIRVGDIVERHLTNGDIILINRQPTLHKCSMLAKKVVVRPGKTIRLNLATTKVFNADFDGDEMNLHVPQDPMARAELMEIAATSKNVISIQSSKPNISVVQDGMLGAYLMTRNDYIIPKNIFMDMCMSIDNLDFSQIHNIVAKVKYTGRALVSLILPRDFDFSGDNICIVDGIITGYFTKHTLSSVIHMLYKDYGECLGFVNNIQYISNVWLLHFGFSIGIKDCIQKPELKDKIERSTIKCFTEASKIIDTVKNDRIRNAKISIALAKGKDGGMKAAKDSFTVDNGFISTVTSGSKGDYFNICQITGLLGQQNVHGQRINPALNNRTRTLPHYSKTKNDNNFESRGFVSNSFIHGLNPKEFFFHSMSGREGVSDTALKTSVSGYTQRKMIKILEDVQIKYDGTVRNSTNDIIQWEYNYDGFDRTQLINVNGNQSFCNVERIANRLNKNHK